MKLMRFTKITFTFLILVCLMMAAMPDEVMTKDGNIYIINTTTLCDKKGFKGNTPLEVYIQNDCVINIKALPNHESKGYFNPMIRRLFPLYENLKVNKAKSLSVNTSIDAITGATFSGNAVQANINAALVYYKKHK